RRLMAKKRDARPSTAKAARELLDLIERDRGAAAAALGLPAATSERSAATLPVDAAVLQASTLAGASRAALEQAPPLPLQPPGGAPPVPSETPAAPPTASGAARAAIDPRAPIAQRDVATSRRRPLGWEAEPRPLRRAPWLVGGAALGIAGILTAVMVVRTADTPDAAPAARIAMTPV